MSTELNNQMRALDEANRAVDEAVGDTDLYNPTSGELEQLGEELRRLAKVAQEVESFVEEEREDVAEREDEEEDEDYDEDEEEE